MNVISILPTAAGPQIAALLALIVVQVILAVALALKEKQFDLRQLADFYQTRVLPMLLGWLAFAVLAKYATQEILGPAYGQITGDSVAWGAWLIVVATLGAKIVEAAKRLYDKKLPFPDPTDQDHTP